jgi:ribosomal peptide maturation radical SAM protein 1
LLLLETARGCWWGEKHHCTFCGLNSDDMTFRSKTPEKALEEMDYLASRYQIRNIEVVDNIISVNYIEKVCKPLIQKRYDYTIFWEVKANLTPVQLRTLSKAGVLHMQPGVESLSTHILGLMRKGITMLKNVRFLKWASYFNINPRWNLLTGFPGETEKDYENQLRLVPLLKHLRPPGGWGQVWLERYSPYFFDPSFPIENIRPALAYSFVYPNSDIDLREVAYFFDYEMKGVLPISYHEGLYALLQTWRDAWAKPRHPALVYRRGKDWLEVLDEREEKSRHHWLYGVEASVYEACTETDHTVDVIVRQLQNEGIYASVADVQTALERFCDLGIMISEDGHYLGLALPLNQNWFSERIPATVKPALELRILEPAAVLGGD